MSKIIVLGSINMDLVFQVSQMPVLGETLAGEGFFMAPGGKGANQAVACANQGAETWMLGSIGMDALSNKNRDSLLAHGVRCDHVAVYPNITCGVAGIFLENGENRIIIDAGANALQDRSRITSFITNQCSEDDILLCQLEIAVDIILDAFVVAKQKGIMTVLNAAPASLLPRELLRNTDLLIVNEIELATISGIHVVDDNDVIRAARTIIQQGVTSIIVTWGESGSIYIDSHTYDKQSAYRVETIDTTAAGDTYIGAYLSHIQEGFTIKDSMKWASAAAAIAVTTLGAQPSIPTKQEVQDFILQEEQND